MALIRFAIVAAFTALMLPFGSALATTNSHSPFSLTDDRTLDLRATGSQLVVDTVEDALRQGGLALFDEGFQLDSSLNWIFGENIEGEIDAVVPLWSGGGHVLFAQPGFVFWTGLADEERIDGNLGIAYRTSLTDDIIGGASVFYDRDFKQGHSRVSFGADVQSGFLHGAANYYQPLNDEEDGREGFVEEALRGMDFRLAFQRDVMRVSGNLGYWRFEGDDSVETDWKISYGLDAGVRILPGVFLEGGWEKHDEDVSLDSRWNAGLAFRFSLPDFKGASYGDGSMSSNLYRIVEREKRILYEERVAGPSVSIALEEGESETLQQSGADSTANITISLSKELEEDVVLNLVGSGTADYGSLADWSVSVGGINCDEITGTNCPITIAAGETAATAEVSVRDDGLGGEPEETIVLSIGIVSTPDPNLRLGNSSVDLTIANDPPVTVTLNYSGEQNVRSFARTRMTINLGESLIEDVALNLVGGGSAVYGPSNDWELIYQVVPANETPDLSVSLSSPPCAGVTGSSCQVTIPAGATIVVVQVDPYEAGSNIMVSVAIPPESSDLAALGNPSSTTLNVVE